MCEVSYYYSFFREAFGTHCGTILFLASIAAYGFQFFNQCEIRQDKPLALLVEKTCEFETVFFLLRSSKEEKLLPTTLSWNEVASALFSSGDQFLFSLYSTNRNSVCNIDRLLDLIENLEMLPSVIIVGFQSCIPEEYADRFTTVQVKSSPEILEKSSLFSNWASAAIQYLVSHREAVINSLDRYSHSRYRYTDNAWLYAAIEVASIMQGETATDAPLARQMKLDLEEALDNASGFQDYIGIPEAVIHCMQKHARESETPMYPISKPPVSDTKELAEYPLYDDACYYFSDQLFRKICEPLLNTLTFTQINEALAREEYQKSENHGAQVYIPRQRGSFQPPASRVNRSNYTPKVTIWTPYGISIRPRFHILNRALIDANQEEPDLLDLYNNNDTTKEGELYDKQAYLIG